MANETTSDAPDVNCRSCDDTQLVTQGERTLECPDCLPDRFSCTECDGEGGTWHLDACGREVAEPCSKCGGGEVDDHRDDEDDLLNRLSRSYRAAAWRLTGRMAA